ncbi:BC1881 family protein [Flavonifractor plautii]|uniref:BC1881 family protein n=1 Tax=Flavonifractor plautii TaxID=292800 RepID=UPI0024B97BB0|nr:BC1881 family protein [Flavonifractor plautii]
MTREEAIECLKTIQRWTPDWDDREDGLSYWDAIDMALSALRPVSREQLSEFKTCDLVDELRKREGVETHIAEPYQDVTVSVNGPAVVLVVID